MKYNAFLNPSERKGFILPAVFVLSISAVSFFFSFPVEAANGVQKTINFQGKVVNADGTNVTDGAYDFVVQIYDGAGNSASSLFSESWVSGSLFSSTMSVAPTTSSDTLTYSSDTNEASLNVGQILWNTTKKESVIITSVNTGTNVLGISRPIQNWSTTDTITNRIYVKDGVFRIAINSLNQDLSAVNFGSDSLFVGVNFNADGEMRPRMQLRSNAYAFNAERVNGLTVTNTSDAAFSTATTLKINDGSTITFGGDFSSGSNALTLTTTGSTSITLPTSGTLATLAGLEVLTNKTIGSTGLVFSGASTDITTASDENLTLAASGTGFIELNDTVKISSLTNSKGLVYADDADGTLLSLTNGTTGQCLNANTSGAPSWGTCGVADGGSNWVLSATNGTLTPINSTLDLLLGGTATASALVKLGGTANSHSFFNSGGNVGIGTTAPDGALTIERNHNDVTSFIVRNQPGFGNTFAQAAFQLVVSGNSGGMYAYPADASVGRWQDRIVLKSDSSSAGFTIEAASAGQDVRFYAGSTTERMRISSGGNVGIGTTDPGGKLAVNGGKIVLGGETFAGATTAMSVLASGLQQGHGLSVENNAEQYWTFIGRNSENNNQINFGGGSSTEGAFEVRSGGTAGSFIVGHTGNVGIGVTNPAYKLHIEDAGEASMYLKSGAGYPGYYIADAVDDNVGLKLQEDGVAKAYMLWEQSNQALQMYENGDYTMTLKNGNVGIGTTNPSNRTLQINATSGSNASFAMSDGDVTHGLTSYTPTNNWFDIISASSTLGGADMAGISSGASTTGLSISGIIGVSNPTDTVPALRLGGMKSNGGTNVTALGNLETVLQVQNNTTPLMTVLGNGNVGIGVTNPSEKLDVAGNIELTGVIKGSDIGAMAYRSLIVGVSAATWTAIAFQNEYYDTDAMHSTSTNMSRMTINTAGKYLLTGTIYHSASSANDQLRFRVNGTDYVGAAMESSSVVLNATAVADLSVGDYVELVIYKGNAGNILVDLPYTPIFAVQRLAGADLAEYYPVSDKSINDGDIVSVDPDVPGAMKKASTPYGKSIGIISSNPAVVMGNTADKENNRLVGLKGKVPVKVSTRNGVIRNGDAITASTLPGFGMKAVRSGNIAAIALDHFNPEHMSCTPVESVDAIPWPEVNLVQTGHGLCYELPDGEYVGQILGYIDNSYHEQITVTQSGDLVIEKAVNGTYKVIDQSDAMVEKIGVYKEVVIGNVTAGLVTTRDLEVIGKVTVQGLSLEEYILSTMNGGLSVASSSAGLTFEERLMKQEVRLTELEHAVASVSAREVISPVMSASASAVQQLSELLMADVSVSPTPVAGHAAALDTDILSANGLWITKSATISGSFRVQGDSLVEGLLHVIETLTANNLIVNSLATFMGEVVFKDIVRFERAPVFTGDTAGYVLVTHGSTHMQVEFDQEYEEVPVVNATLMTTELTDDDYKKLVKAAYCSEKDGKAACQLKIDQELLTKRPEFIVTDRSRRGFTILLSKPADIDYTFSWTALHVGE